MLYSILVWLMLWGVCLCIGITELSILSIGKDLRSGDRLILAEWLGLLSISVGLLMLSLIMPISFGLCFGIGIAIVVLSLSFYPTQQAVITHYQQFLQPKQLLSSFLLLVTVGLLMIYPVTWFDTGLYHFGMLRWLSNHGAVPGLALLHGRFAFSSSWFAIAAPLNPAWLNSGGSATLNGFVVLLLGIYGLIALRRALQNRATRADWFALSSIFLLGATALPIRSVIISFSPDIPVILLTLFVCWTWLLSSQELENNRNFPCVSLCLAAATVSLKLSAIPLLTIAVFYFIYQMWGYGRGMILGLFTAGCILMPGLLYAVRTSGCPVYPSTVFCLNLPWTVPTAAAQHMAGGIRGWNHWFAPPPEGANPTLWVLQQWLSMGTSQIGMLVLVVVAVVGTAIGLSILLKQGKLQQYAVETAILVLAAFGSIFVFLQAPLIRFALGYLVLFPSLIAALLCDHFWGSSIPIVKPISWERFQRFWNRPMRLGSAILFVLVIGVGISISTSSWRSMFLSPPVPSAALSSAQVNDVQYFYPSDPTSALCWDAPLPCRHGDRLEYAIRLRDPSQGFSGGYVRADLP